MDENCETCGHEMGTTAPFTGFGPCQCGCHPAINQKYGNGIGD